MTENCQNYLSLGVVQNEKSVQAVLRCLSFFGLSFVFKQHIPFNTSSSRFILQNKCDFLLDIFHCKGTLQNFVSLCNQTTMKICESFCEIFL